MQEFLKNEQEKYIYYYNDNEQERFYFYQQMPENTENNLYDKQEFFKRIFCEWKSKQIDFLLQQMTLDIQTYFQEKLDLVSSLAQIENFRSILNSTEPNSNYKSIEKANLNDLNSSKNHNLILYNNINNFTLIQGTNSVQINERKNFTSNNSNNFNNSNNDNTNKIPLSNGEKNNLKYCNTVSINDICKSSKNNFINENIYENSQKASILPNKEIDFSFFSNRSNTDKLINYLLSFMQGIEKEMLIYVQEELENNTYLRNESIYFLLDSYNSIFNQGKKQRAECNEFIN